MIDDLYQSKMISLARTRRLETPLEYASAKAEINNKLCGDKITVELLIEDGKIVEISQKVRACVLCEASASMLQLHAIGATAIDFETATHDIKALWENAEHFCKIHWPELKLFSPVRDYKNRWTCVLMPLDAVALAFKNFDQS